jgi:hypothetical protein
LIERRAETIEPWRRTLEPPRGICHPDAMRRMVAAALSSIVLAAVACHSGDSSADAASSHAKADSSFRNLGKRDSSPVSPWNEGAVTP